MPYIDKYQKILPFVKLNIPHNKKNFTKQEKRKIDYYYKLLKPKGYLNREKEGYVIKNISRTKYKKAFKNQKAIIVNVGTKVENGKITTNTKNKVKIRNGKIIVEYPDKTTKRQVAYNIIPDWKPKDFRKHIREAVGKINKNMVIATNAGDTALMFKNPKMHTVAEKLDDLSDRILAMANRYTVEFEDGERESAPEDFMQYLTIYESKEGFLQDLNSQLRAPRKRKSKRKLRKGKRS
ncbi:MAG: hypothetical protein SFU99_03950 [Saprospiraceae bacterium]|nr:hypothetical protein [Saprospiraceae bacterium]